MRALINLASQAMALCLFCNVVLAVPQEKSPDKASNGVKTSLFDGKTLDGWDGDPKFWSVEDGAITGQTTSENPTKGNTFCVFKGEDLGDFELEFQYRIENHNSGVQFRSFRLDNAADQWRIGGYQADFDANNNWTGTLYGEKFRGILTKRGQKTVLTEAPKNESGNSRLAAERTITPLDNADRLADKIKTLPEWNTYRVVAKGFVFKLYVNGQLMSECHDKDEANRRAKGLLALQLHGGPPMKVQFKDVNLTRTSSETVADEATDPSLLLEEDFENGIARWEIVDPKSWKIEEHGLGKSLSIIQRESEYEPKVRSPKHIALLKELNVASFELKFKVKSTKDTGNHRDCCIFFNYQDPTNYYYIHLGAKPDPNSGQIFIVNDAPRSNLTNNQKRVPWTDDWHTVKVVRDAAKGSIAVYFDDMENPHLQVNDKTFGKGRIGIGSFDDMNAFDSIEVRALETE